MQNVDQLLTKIEAGFSFAEVALIAADTLDVVGEVHSTKVSARLKHLQRLGVPARRPGRGAKKPYSLDELLEIEICLQFVESGMDPTMVVDVLRSPMGPQMIIRLHEEFTSCAKGVRRGIMFGPQEAADHVWFEPSLSTFYWNNETKGSINIQFGNKNELLSFMAGNFERVMVMNIGAVAHGIFCAVLRLLGVWD